MADERLRCHCWWRGERCTNQATAEDMLCTWCAPIGARSEEEIRQDPKSVVVNGRVYVGGAGQLHDGTFEQPGACWYPSSDREIR